MVRPSLVEDVNNLRAKRKACGKILNLAIFSSQVALSLHFSFELRVNLMHAHLTYPARFYFSNIQSGNETTSPTPQCCKVFLVIPSLHRLISIACLPPPTSWAVVRNDGEILFI